MNKILRTFVFTLNLTTITNCAFGMESQQGPTGSPVAGKLSYADLFAKAEKYYDVQSYEAAFKIYF